MIDNGMYQLKVYCSNCGFNNEINIPKKVAVKYHPCPNCENEGLKRDYNKTQEYVGDDDGSNY